MPARYTTDQFVEKLKAHEFDSTRLSNNIATRDGALPTAELLANLESDPLHHWTPPGGGQHGALNHAVIHALDAAHPLNATHVIDDDTIMAALDDLTSGGIHAHFGTTIEGRHLEATDLAWDHGTGTPLRGPARELALTLCGRVMPANDLDGPAL
jgi:hypothetical protein